MRKFEVVSAFKDKGVILPTRATEFSAGYDIRVLTPNENVIEIGPYGTFLFHTGIKVYMEKDEVFIIFLRSSIGIKKHLILSNTVGVIDSDYVDNIRNEGEILVSLTNMSDVTQYINHNERVAQGVFMKYLTTDDDNTVVRRMGGIGSTDYRSQYITYSSSCA